ncbi:flagellar assembly protein FliH [Solimicrobium silvestre]|uniref:Flagellar assembly protein FliH n=1 Tax=Solimicrobium silvestre TaxID=2099400 RepID=A0A2S9GST3_9BURK|nr:flagellar assembly protein FliH [Solimicrobium silvestre]PRC90779.1 Flagellar biosynthesis/type III secretory pathway protein [Solimicrobium silvestre]
MRLSDVIAKGKLSAYQRWEMTSFEENTPENKKPGTDKAVVQITESNQKELDDLKVSAQKEGFAKGFEEGHQVGLKTGQQEEQQELVAFKQISTQFNASLQQAEHLVAQEVLDLALDIAKAMLKNALTINPELIIPIIEQAIASLPSVQQPAQLFLNPKDAILVQAKIGAELSEAGWVIVPDAHLKIGDCRIETMKNQINASLSSRWQQIAEALGRENSWYVVDHTEHRR